MKHPGHYRHQHHAANLSDVLKHLCLSSLRHQNGLESIWDAFTAEPYTLTSQLAIREPLLHALLNISGPVALKEFQQLLRGFCNRAGESAYPGSASLLAGFDALRTLWLSDRDGGCAARQRQVFSHYTRPRVEVLCMDSVQEAGQVLVQGPDLVFIDPPFLQQDEWQGILSLLDEVWQTRADSRVVLWYPLRDGFVVPERLQQLPGWRMQFLYTEGQGLQGCVVLLVNFGDELEALLRPLATCLDGPMLPGLRAARCVRQL